MPTASKKPVAAAAPERKVLHPHPAVEIYTDQAPADGSTLVYKPLMTAERMKELLGWQEEEPQTDSSPGTKFGSDYLLLDESDKKVRCVNNDNNRPLTESWSRTLAQDILNKNWQFNGETFVVSTHGRVLSGQHRGIGLVLAQQVVEKNPARWDQEWPDGVVRIPMVVMYGISEDPRVTRTLDNVKPRSLADVLFADTKTFGKISAGNRAKLCKMTENALRQLWHRTGADDKAFNPGHTKQTHSESLDWIDRHPHIIRAVKHIYEEFKADWKKASQIMTPGYASALLYLMGCSSSDGDVYRATQPPSEKTLDWDRWELACDYWVELIKASAKTHEVRMALGGLNNADDGTVGSVAEKIAVIIKGWNQYCQGQDITPEDLALRYRKTEDGDRVLTEVPLVDGIDLGAGKSEKDDEEAPAADPAAEPTPEEVAAAKAQVDADRTAKEAQDKADKEAKKAKLLEDRKNNPKAGTKATPKAGSPAPAANGTPAAAPAAKPNPKPRNRKEVQAENTRKAAEADAAKAAGK